MRKRALPTVAAAVKSSRQAATEQDSSTTSTSSTDGAAARPDEPSDGQLPAAGADVEQTERGDEEGRSRQADGARSHDLHDDTATTAQEPSRAGVSDSEAGAASVAAPLEVAELVGCGERMFLSGSGVPVASGQPGVRDKPTYELCCVAVAGVKKLPPALFDKNLPLSQRPCGQLDKEEAAGYIVRDRLGYPLMLKDDARDYGDKVRKRAEKAAKAVAAAQKACRGPFDSAEEKEAALEAARLTVLRAAVDPPLPPVRDAPVAAAPAPVPPPTPPPPSRAERWLKHHVHDAYTIEDYRKERAKCAAPSKVRECWCAALSVSRLSQEDRRSCEARAALAAKRACPGIGLLAEDDACRGG